MVQGRQRVFATLLIDVALVLLASIAAVVVRDNMVLSLEKLWALGPYLLATTVTAALVFLSAKTPHAIWRFSGRSDYGRILISVVLVVLISCVTTFAYDRLDNVSRSLPLLQATFAAGLMISARALFRTWRARRQAMRARPRLFRARSAARRTSVLVVGVSRLAEVYLRAVEEFAQEGMEVVGVLGQRDRQTGRQIGGYPVLGRAEVVRDIVGDLETHGIVVERIVITCRLEDLSDAARQAVFALEVESGITVQVLIDQFGLTPLDRVAKVPPAPRFLIEPARLALNSRRIYWRLKRVIDIVGAVVLLLALAPLAVVAGTALAFSLGFPILFWQQRPGLGGRPFRLFKMRTMHPAHDAMGRRLSEEERTSRVGDIVRRTRLDEVPQLLSILAGDMSFIGPRPLLPCDQSPSDRARLLVRPGLTGWAQVTGGREISADDKAVLDVWYIQNASLLLDLQIVVRTVPIVLFGERVCRADIARAWHDLKVSGIVSDGAPRTIEEAA